MRGTGGAVLAMVVALAHGRSYAFIRMPVAASPPAMDPREVRCNASSLFPSLDAVGGALALAASGGGIIEEHTSDRLDHFTLYYAGPLFVLSLVYFYSASFGTARVGRCQELKDAAAAHVPPSTDIRD